MRDKPRTRLSDITYRLFPINLAILVGAIVFGAVALGMWLAGC